MREDRPSCRICGDDLVYTGDRYICEQCNDVVDVSVGGSFK